MIVIIVLSAIVFMGPIWGIGCWLESKNQGAGGIIQTNDGWWF